MTVDVHQLPGRPAFHRNPHAIGDERAVARHRQGWLIGRTETPGLGPRSEAVPSTRPQDAVKSSEIGGETLDRDQVRSSIARRLGMNIGALPAADRHVEGAVEMMRDATQSHGEPLARGLRLPTDAMTYALRVRSNCVNVFDD